MTRQLNHARFWLTFATFTLLVTACASPASQRVSMAPIRVTFESEPPGAILTIDGMNYGRAPVTLEYDAAAVRAFGGRITGGSAQWISGATAEQGVFFIDLSRPHYSYRALFTRPASYPGIETDIQYFQSLREIATAERSAKAQQDALACQQAMQSARDRCEHSSKNPSFNSGYDCGQAQSIARRICRH